MFAKYNIALFAVKPDVIANTLFAAKLASSLGILLPCLTRLNFLILTQNRFDVCKSLVGNLNYIICSSSPQTFEQEAGYRYFWTS